jgi:hypothetical protein
VLCDLALVDVPELVFVAVAVVETLIEEAGLALLSPAVIVTGLKVMSVALSVSVNVLGALIESRFGLSTEAHIAEVVP